ncbi:centrosomal protein of 72 kDa-like [Dendronephthya gigantea]|uniref:centrosomal protein of 72 kDa-like n=1 Tax=Dendronephthya gigantea TaxID=151771 RepID=UPI00106CA59F|nr:centrosomal protein of 72 kDa-like [Dendronephthya gigantea]
MALKIDEEWIRQRVHLEHDNLDDVKSLSLPGSYHEKISHLGSSLHSFTRLKHLDLSRNVVCNLEGISHLQMLETLNLYYNNISTLKDLYQLRTLTNLKELDIRLNPVTKNEPDHRLFLIHMLPSLRKLDDRSVRDSERKAALMHFNTDQASEFINERFQDDFTNSNDRFHIPPRAELVRNLGPRSALDNDDVRLLDAITRKNAGPTFISGSSSKFPDVEDYPRQELADMHIMDEEKGAAIEKSKEIHHKIPPISLPVDYNGNVIPPPYPPTQKSHKRVSRDSQYAPHTTQGNFTPNPRSVAHHQTEHDSDIPKSSSDSQESGNSEDNIPQRSRHFIPDQHPGLKDERNARSLNTDSSSSPSGNHRNKSSPSFAVNNELRVLHKLVDLVDKYWNGSKSLHNHTKFKDLAIAVLKNYRPTLDQPERDMTSLRKLREEMLTKEEELKKLSEQLKEQEEECSEIREQLGKEKEKRQLFEETSQELTTLHERFQHMQEENQFLKTKLESQKNTEYERQKKSDEAIIDVKSLHDENHKLKQRLSQQNENLQQLNELASMLQESHRSLVATNDHLLLELSQEKDRHQAEVNQLHWSYKQLKKSMDWLPNVGKTSHKT